MGYHAPSAEEVYRYIFRIDEQERSLSDRFSRSILFINDSSARSREFLASHCLDLCLRTADRIRFVFFSEMLPTDMARMADGLNSGRTNTIVTRSMGLALNSSFCVDPAGRRGFRDPQDIIGRSEKPPASGWPPDAWLINLLRSPPVNIDLEMSGSESNTIEAERSE
jgi:hypothetical protein